MEQLIKLIDRHGGAEAGDELNNLLNERDQLKRELEQAQSESHRKGAMILDLQTRLNARGPDSYQPAFRPPTIEELEGVLQRTLQPAPRTRPTDEDLFAHYLAALLGPEPFLHCGDAWAGRHIDQFDHIATLAVGRHRNRYPADPQ